MCIKKISILNLLIIIFFILPVICLAADDAYQYFESGISLFEQENYEGASEAFRRAVEIKEDFVEAYYNLGVVCDLLEKLPEAIEAYKAVIRLDPNTEDLWESLALDSYLVGNIEEAVYFARLAESRGKPINKILYIRILTEHRKRAEGISTPVSGLDSEELRAMEMRLKSDIASLDAQLKQEDRPTPEDLLELGTKYRQIGNIDKAIDVLKRAIGIDENNYLIQAELSLCYFLNGQKDLFDRYFKKARQLGYTPSASLYDLYYQTISKH